MTLRPAIAAVTIGLIGMTLLYAFSFVSSIISQDDGKLTTQDTRAKLLTAHARRVVELHQSAVASYAGMAYSGRFNIAIDASLSDATTIWTAMAAGCDGSVEGLMLGLTGVDGSYFCVYCTMTPTTLAWASRIRNINASYPRFREYYTVWNKHGTDNRLSIDTVNLNSSAPFYDTMARSWVKLAIQNRVPSYLGTTISFSSGMAQTTFVLPIFSAPPYESTVSGVGAAFIEPLWWHSKFSTAGPGFLLLERGTNYVLFCSDEVYQWPNQTIKGLSDMSTKYNNDAVKQQVAALNPIDSAKQGGTTRVYQQNAYVSVYSANAYLNFATPNQYGPGAIGLDLAVISIQSIVNVDGQRPLYVLVTGGVAIVLLLVLMFMCVRKFTPDAKVGGEYAKDLNPK